MAAGEDRGADLQAAVERFVERHAAGDGPDPVVFVAGLPEALRSAALQQIREFLAFDGLVGRQEWTGGSPAEPGAGGRTFGDFTIREELGRGGMGIVYLAHQRSLNRLVALKVMASGLTLSKRHVERFRREAAAAAQLRHPAIVPVHAFTEVDGTFAFAMDFVAGRNLADILDDLRLANAVQAGDGGAAEIEGSLGLAPEKGYVAECAMLCAQVASALAAAHQAGVVHRDLKPRNLMLDERRQVRLLDFGLAKSAGEGSISMSGEITGTVHYMSPEQTLAKRVAVDHRSDVFSLGVILYELLTLRRPFDGRNLQQIVYEICFREPVPAAHRNRKVPRDLWTICQKALEKEPHNRFASAAEFEADLLRFLRWEPILARPAGALTRLGKLLRRRRTEVLAAGAVLAIGGAALGHAWYEGRTRSQAADDALAAAATAAAGGDLELAVRHATTAVGLRDDAATRTQLELHTQRRVTAAILAEKVEKEAALLAQHSSQQLDRDRALALQLAREAFAVRPSAQTRTAVLDALGAGHRVTALPTEGLSVVAARWSPDGACIVGTTTAGTVLLWDAGAGTVAQRLVGHRQWVLDAAFLPDTSQVATAGADRTVRFWQLADGSERGSWELDGAVTLVVLDARGSRVLCASGSGSKGPFRAEVRDAATGERLGAKEHRQHVVAAALAPSGRWAASWGGDGGDALLWDAATGRELARLGGHKDRLTQIVFAPDGSSVATASRDGAVRWFAAPGGEPLGTGWHSRPIDALAFDPSGEHLLSGGRDHTARLWRLDADGGTTTLREARTFVGHGGGVLDVDFAPNGELVATASQDGIVRVFDARSGGDAFGSEGAELRRYEVGPAIAGAQFDRDGRRLLVRAGAQRLLVWDCAQDLGVVTLRQTGPVPSAAFASAGTAVITAGDDERVRCWQAANGQLAWVRPLGKPVQCVDVHAGVVACSTTDGALHLLDGATGELRASWPAHADKVPCLRFSASGDALLSAGRDGRVVLWDLDAPTARWSLQRPGPVVAADLDAQGGLVATVEQDEACARLWTPAGEPRGELRGHDKPIASVLFHPDGRTILTASRDGTVRRSSRDGTLRLRIDAGQALQHVAVSPDGALLLTSAADRTAGARLWRADDGTEVLAFRGHRAEIERGAFSPDGSWALTTSRDGTTRLWPTDPVALAARLPLRTLSDDDRRRFGLAIPPTTR